jgi:hypothetical protein
MLLAAAVTALACGGGAGRPALAWSSADGTLEVHGYVDSTTHERLHGYGLSKQRFRGQLEFGKDFARAHPAADEQAGCDQPALLDRRDVARCGRHFDMRRLRHLIDRHAAQAEPQRPQQQAQQSSPHGQSPAQPAVGPQRARRS